MKYTLVNADGFPVGKLDVPPSLLDANVSVGTTAVPSEPPADNYMWDGTSWVELEAKPTDHHKWSKERGWYDTRSSERILKAAREDINKKRSASSLGTFPFRGKRVQADQHSRHLISTISNVVALSGELPPSWCGYWRCESNETVDILTRDDWLEFVMANYEHDRRLFESAVNSKQQLEENSNASNP